MADPSVVADTMESPNHTSLTATDFNSLPIPPLDPTIFSEDLILHDDFISFSGLEDFNLDFTIDDDDLYLQSQNQDFLTTLPSSIEPSASLSPNHAFPRVRVSNNPDSTTAHELRQFSADPTIDVSNSPSSVFSQDSGDRCSDVSRFLDVPSPESAREPSQESGNKCLNAAKILDYPSPDAEIRNEEISGPASSQGSGNCGSAVLDAQNYPSPDSGNCSRSLPSSLDCANILLDDGADDQKIKLEELANNCFLKRKKENEDVISVERTSKYRRSNDVDNANSPLCGFDATNEEEEKRKARLMRNRESAQLSRQRKKHYVEELEDKVRTMHSTIQDLNSKISFIMADNASLRQQLSGGAMCPPPPVPLHGSMYPHPPPPMGYPWMPCPPPYVVKSQGSQVPLVPIPRLKPQHPAPAPKAKKAETKKAEGKTKKVASVSFLGLLFFIMLFGGLVPMVNVKYGGMRDVVTGGTNYIGNKFNDQHRGRVLTVNAHLNGTDQNIGIGLSNTNFGSGKDLTNTMHRGGSHIGGAESNVEPKGRGSHPLPGSDEFVHIHNASEPLTASLYVPRNDKLVKIDGNLIIHSILASEKAMASRETPETKSRRETGLAVPRNLSPAIPLSGRNNGRRPRLYRNPTERQRAIASAAAERDNLKSKSADGKLQQWFREGLAGPMLRSGMCTEVFQFDVSPASAPGGIIPATSVRNISVDIHQNSTQLNKGRNRRILHGLPIPLPGSVNISKEHVARNSAKDNFQGNDSLSSMVVSVLVDPREGGDSDGDGTMGPKSLSRIFVVVLLDSVKYVTYSCMLPLKGTGPHLVTT